MGVETYRSVAMGVVKGKAYIKLSLPERIRTALLVEAGDVIAWRIDMKTGAVTISNETKKKPSGR